MSDIEKELFSAFAKRSCGDLELYNMVLGIAKEEVSRSLGQQAADHYDVLTTLMYNENNAGWKDRHSDRIEIIRQATRKIEHDHEAFLP